MKLQSKIDYDLFGSAPRQPRHFVRVGGYPARPGTGPAGETFTLSSLPLWVRPIAAAASVIPVTTNWDA